MGAGNGPHLGHAVRLGVELLVALLHHDAPLPRKLHKVKEAVAGYAGLRLMAWGRPGVQGRPRADPGSHSSVIQSPALCQAPVISFLGRDENSYGRRRRSLPVLTALRRSEDPRCRGSSAYAMASSLQTTPMGSQRLLRAVAGPVAGLPVFGNPVPASMLFSRPLAQASRSGEHKPASQPLSRGWGTPTLHRAFHRHPSIFRGHWLLHCGIHRL